MDAHDTAALAHYEALIALHYPPHLAAMLAAARYQAQIGACLPLLRDTLVAVQEAHPDLRRDVGRTVAAIDRRKIKTGGAER